MYSIKQNFLLSLYKGLWLLDHFGRLFFSILPFEAKRQRLHGKILKSQPKIHDSKQEVKYLSHDNEIIKAINENQPFVIPGGAKASRAFARWDFDYFRDNYGDQVQPAFTNEKVEQQVNLKSLAKIIEDVHEGKDVSLLFGNLVVENKGLQDDLELEEFKRKFHSSLSIMKIDHFFINSKNAKTMLHAELGNNFFIQLRGKKRWLIFPPEASPYFKPAILNKFYLEADPALAFVEQSDLLAKTKHWDVELEEGDILFIPALFWHYVNTREDSISVSSRWTQPLKLLKHPFLTLLLLTAKKPSVFTQVFLNSSKTYPDNFY